MKTILLIEDDRALRENTEELLELSGYMVLTAPNGKLGIELAKEKIPDLIICDIMMPIIDGYGVLENISKDEKTKQIPFIFLSAKTEQKEIEKGIKLGADDYLTKPFEEEDIISTIESQLAKAKLMTGKHDKTLNDHGVSEDELQSLNEL
ncbi:response regulator [uncultured Maribacter sp.]|uniref:response regulator transcription factor n=1 Tax=uncultured Maribacter sp. TaxID=431308 RepID=UPI0030DB87F3|tara:strand:+ start:3053 stop:3502 length:450 start_codon:yes stop_codon:yes gene_type:complete